MNKITYEQRLAATHITDNMTVAEAKQAKRQTQELNRFWRRTVTAYLLRERQVDLAQAERTHVVKYVYDLKATGSIRVELWFEPAGWGDFGAFSQPNRLVRTYRIRKQDLYK